MWRFVWVCRYVDAIERAYGFASHRLLELLVRERRLMERLRSVKRFFLLEAAEVVEGFLDRAEHELNKTVSAIQVHPTPLHSLQLKCGCLI
jgi:gamma-tubulin complex component 2